MLKKQACFRNITYDSIIFIEACPCHWVIKHIDLSTNKIEEREDININNTEKNFSKAYEEVVKTFGYITELKDEK